MLFSYGHRLTMLPVQAYGGLEEINTGKIKSGFFLTTMKQFIGLSIPHSQRPSISLGPCKMF